MYIKRHIENAVLERAKMKGAVVVTGARQVGKTTLIENLKPDVTKITFDDLTTRRRAVEEPSVFFDFYPPPVFIDKVQYAPVIFHYIKILLDKSRNKGDFFLTGSQSFELMQNVTESLAGRAGILELLGLSLREINGESWKKPFIPTLEYLKAHKTGKSQFNVAHTWEIIHRGCMPELVANPDFKWQEFYADYTKTYIERDVRKLTQVADEESFLKFMTVCAAMTGQMLNLSSIAKDVGISEPTAKRWLSILKTSGIVYLLKPYSNNAIKRAVKTPMLHFLDIGLAAYLTRWLTPETLSNGAMKGYFYESFVISEILKSYTNSGLEADLYFLRDGHQKEIDLLIYENNTLYPIEIKTTAEPDPGDIKNFSMLDSLKGVNIGEGGVICMAHDIMPLKDKNYIIPLWAL
ncbi:MAG: ATP-binding protein [Eubacteriales bacterium]|nr:ATP-binding protein [Eubacteriales bacterium]